MSLTLQNPWNIPLYWIKWVKDGCQGKMKSKGRPWREEIKDKWQRRKKRGGMGNEVKKRREENGGMMEEWAGEKTIKTVNRHFGFPWLHLIMTNTHTHSLKVKWNRQTRHGKHFLICPNALTSCPQRCLESCVCVFSVFVCVVCVCPESYIH